MRDLPQWLSDYIQKIATLLGVYRAWNIHCEMATPDRLEDLHGAGTADACTKMIPHLNKATIYFSTALLDNEEGRITVWHELLHVLHSRVWDAATTAMEQLPDVAEKVAREYYRQMDESFVEALARQLYCLVESKPD